MDRALLYAALKKDGAEQSESGNPVVLNDMREGQPLDITVRWEPTQEGEGAPYPPGGRKNLLDITKCTSRFTAYGLTMAIKDDLVTIKGTSSVTLKPASFNILSVQDYSLSGHGYIITAFAANGSVTNAYGLRTETERNIAVSMPLEEGEVVDVALHIMVSVDMPTSYEPYANIRPIRGRDSVTMTRYGRNLLKITPFDKIVKNGITFEYIEDGGIRITGTATANTDSPIFPVPYLPPGKYYGSNAGSGTSESIVLIRDGRTLWVSTKGAFEILAGDVIRYWYVSIIKGSTVNKVIYPYIAPGSTAPATYAPYCGDTLDFALPCTMYGGNLNAVTGMGEETVKIIIIDGSTLKFKANSTGTFWNLPQHTTEGINEILAISHFSKGYFSFNDNYDFIFTQSTVIKRFFASVDELNTFLVDQYAAGTPVQIAYQLAEPIPFNATGDKIKALRGVNTIMTDADSVTVKAGADLLRAKKLAMLLGE